MASGGNSTKKEQTKAQKRPQRLPTLSYHQLQTEYASMQETINDLKGKTTTHQQALHKSKTLLKKCEKENRDLTQRLEEVQNSHRENFEKQSKEWTTRNAQLKQRLESCERQLDKMGVDPVSLDILRKQQEEDTSRGESIAEEARILREKLVENVRVTTGNLTKMQEISAKCQKIMDVQEQD